MTIKDFGLSFATNGTWLPNRSGDYGVDCATGRACADELQAAIRAEQNPLLFGAAVRAMIAGGAYEGTEIGFCQRVAEIVASAAPTPAPLG